MMNKTKRFYGLVVITVAVAFCAAVPQVLAQAPKAAGDAGLAGMIPTEAVFYLERRGHTAVREAFLASNLGKMATDDAINQFVHGSRVQIGKLIVRGMFDLDEAQAIAKHREILHEFLLPFWYNPSAMFVVLDDKMESTPGMGFICVTGKYAKKTRSALESLMKIGVPPAGTEGFRQLFTHKSGTITWRGVAKRDSVFNLSKDQIRKSDSLFMVHWAGKVLYIATTLRAADALGRTVTKAGKKTEGKSATQNFQVVMKKTVMKDWAFRWYLDLEAMMKIVQKKNRDEDAMFYFKALGFGKVGGMGGTGGYADNVYTRLTYVYAPKADGGLVRILKSGGSYKRAFAMTPSESTFCLAGQMDKKSLKKMVTSLVMASAGIPYERVITITSNGETTTKPGEKEIDEELAKKIKQIKTTVDALVDASDGNITGFVTELQAMVGMFGGGGPPVGAVLGLKDRAKAVKAIDELLKLAGVADQGDEAGVEGRPVRAKQYRNIPIRYIGDMIRIAIMKDRTVIALSDNTLKSAIDTALDKTGGFEQDSKGDKLLKLTGDGSGIFVMDLAAVTKLFWPMLMQMTQMQGAQDYVPFVSLPSANKMVRMLGPEIAVFKPDRDGLLMKSRGIIPFSTKFMLFYPIIGFMMF